MTSSALFHPPGAPEDVLAAARHLVSPPALRDPGEAVVAADLGATKLAAACAGDRVVATRAALPVGRSAADELDAVVGALAGLAARSGAAPALVVLAAAPELDAGGRVTAWPNRPHWVGLDLVGRIAGALSAPVVALDDGHAAALAEAGITGLDDLVYVGLGTGVGGGCVSGGAVLPAGGLGHRPGIPAGGPRCRCGRRGCVQAIASGPAVLARAEALAGRPVTPAGLRLSVIAGASWARAAVDEAGAAVASALAVTVGPGAGACHVGGGFGARFPEVAAAADRALRRRGLPVRARPARAGADASLLGASHLAAACVLAPTKGALR